MKRGVKVISPPYSEEIHVKNLVEILQVEDIWNECPGAMPKSSFRSKRTPNEIIYDCSSDSTHPCEICMGFVGLDINKDGKICPCHHFGVEEAIKVSIESLKTKGYMKND